MTQQTRRSSTHVQAVRRVREAETFAVNLPVAGRVNIPRPDQLAFYGGLAALAALGVIDWPVALVITAGHVLATNHHNRVVQELGEALEDA